MDLRNPAYRAAFKNKSFIAIGGLCVAVSLTASIFLGRRVRAQAESELIIHTRNLSQSITAQMFERFGDSQAFALNPALIEAVEHQSNSNIAVANQVLGELNAIYKVYPISILSDVTGKVLTVSYHSPFTEADIKSLHSQKFPIPAEFSDSHFPGTSISDFKVVSSDGPKLSNQPLQSFSSPVRNRDNQIIGMITNFADFLYLKREVQNSFKNFSFMSVPIEKTAIFNSAGKNVYSYDDESKAKSILSTSEIDKVVEKSTSAVARVGIIDSRMPDAPHWEIALQVDGDRFFANVFWTQIFAFGVSALLLGIIVFFIDRFVKTQFAQEKKLSEALIAAQEAERVRISRELHDELGQSCSAVRMQLANFDGKTIIELRQKIISSREMLKEMSDSIRRISLELHPSLLKNLGLVESVKWKLQQFKNEALMNVNFTFDDKIDFSSITLEEKAHLYRIFQESINNIYKHACANNVFVSLKQEKGHLTFEIKDDGIGFTEEIKNSSLGLQSMRERARLMNGSLEISSDVNSGTKVKCVIPYTRMELDYAKEETSHS